jgi:hypothetical protein
MTPDIERQHNILLGRSNCRAADARGWPFWTIAGKRVKGYRQVVERANQIRLAKGLAPIEPPSGRNA